MFDKIDYYSNDVLDKVNYYEDKIFKEAGVKDNLITKTRSGVMMTGTESKDPNKDKAKVMATKGVSGALLGVGAVGATGLASSRMAESAKRNVSDKINKGLMAGVLTTGALGKKDLRSKVMGAAGGAHIVNEVVGNRAQKMSKEFAKGALNAFNPVGVTRAVKTISKHNNSNQLQKAFNGLVKNDLSKAYGTVGAAGLGATLGIAGALKAKNDFDKGRDMKKKLAKNAFEEFYQEEKIALVIPKMITQGLAKGKGLFNSFAQQGVGKRVLQGSAMGGLAGGLKPSTGVDENGNPTNTRFGGVVRGAFMGGMLGGAASPIK